MKVCCKFLVISYMKKSIVSILFFLIGNFTFAQTDKIVKLLNEQFEKEQKMYDEGDSYQPKFIQPFQIKNDSLSFEFSMPYNNTENEIITTRRTVHLKDIEQFIKDVNVLFITKKGSVKEIYFTKDYQGKILKKEERQTYLFFTEFRKDEYDQYLQREMIEAFKKAGYTITSEDWWN